MQILLESKLFMQASLIDTKQYQRGRADETFALYTPHPHLRLKTYSFLMKRHPSETLTCSPSTA